MSKKSNNLTKNNLKNQLREAILWGEHPDMWVSDRPFSTKLSQTDYILDAMAVRLTHSASDKKLDFINDLPNWRMLDIPARRELGISMYDWLLERQGIYGVAHIYNKDKDKDCFGYSYNDRLQINEEACLLDKTPYTLFVTLAHELQHRKQLLHNTLIKKGDNNELWSDLYLIHQELEEDEEGAKALYYSAPKELDARKEEVRALAALRSKMLEIGTPSMLIEVNTIDELINATKEDIHYESIAGLDYYSDNGKKLNELNKKVDDFGKGIISNIKQAADENNLEEYVGCGEGAKELINLFNTLQCPQQDMSAITDLLLNNGHMEGIAAINKLDYQHTPEQLGKACELINKQVGSALLTPIAFKYLTHIPANELGKACADVIGQDKVDMQLDAIKNMLSKKLIEFPALFASDYNENGDWKPITPDDPNTYSAYLNNVYPNYTDEFVNEFENEYKTEIMHNSNDSKVNQLREIVLTNIEFANSISKLNRANLSEFDYLFTNGRRENLDAKYRGSYNCGVAENEPTA